MRARAGGREERLAAWRGTYLDEVVQLREHPDGLGECRIPRLPPVQAGELEQLVDALLLPHLESRHGLVSSCEDGQEDSVAGVAREKFSPRSLWGYATSSGLAT